MRSALATNDESGYSQRTTHLTMYDWLRKWL